MNKHTMNFDTRYFTDNAEQITKNTIMGAYFRYQRLQQNISLSDAAKSMRMNKGFLSDLERGNRHFPEGTIHQFNDFYLTNFTQNEQTYQQSYTLLNNAFLAYFQLNTQLEHELLKSFATISSEEIHSYGFFTYKLIELFYQVRLANNRDVIQNLIVVLYDNLNVFSAEEKAIYFDICGEYYLQDSASLFKAEDCFKKSNSYCSKSSIIYALNIYQLTIVFEKTNRSALALLNINRAKDELKHTHSYLREYLIDIYSAKCLIQLGLQSNAQDCLRVIQFSNFSQFIQIDDNIQVLLQQTLSFSYLLNNQFQEALQTLQNIDIACWMIPYALCKLNKHEQCSIYFSLHNNDIPKKEKDLWFALQAFNKNDFENTYFYARLFYLQSLENNNYEILYFTLNFLLSIVDKNDKRYQPILMDLNSLHNNTLTCKTSCLL